MHYRRLIPLFITVTLLSQACKNTPQPNAYGEGLTKTTATVDDIDSLIAAMTLEEKMGMIHASSSFTSGGVPRLGIPELIMSDGPHGVRHEHGRDWVPDDTDEDMNTYLPTGIALASTWNRELGYRYGTVLGNEAKARGKHIILGPGLNIIRSPLNGRNFEYLSEDPFLTAQMGTGYIQGVQAQGIATCVKHYVANNQETDRFTIDAIVSERALREIYLPAFKAGVEADAWTFMGAYNLINGQHATHHEYLINEVLKGEYGFGGAVISDWGAVNDTKEALIYGNDIEMGTDLSMLPNPNYDKFYTANAGIKMVNSGEVDETVIDDKVRRILQVMFKTPALGNASGGALNAPEHQEIARKVAEEAVVLLKNENNLLPLSREEIKTLAVIGHNANRKFAERGGSSQVKALYEITVLEGIQKLVGDGVEVVFAEGYQPNEKNQADGALASEAIAVAENAD
ncbi:MAG TPA: glycosyl hydrolase, partial [Cytophagales bacterium]|nr:glycosyl hydrolase [Cytophagales bacterium]